MMPPGYPHRIYLGWSGWFRVRDEEAPVFHFFPPKGPGSECARVKHHADGIEVIAATWKGSVLESKDACSDCRAKVIARRRA